MYNTEPPQGGALYENESKVVDNTRYKVQYMGRAAVAFGDKVMQTLESHQWSPQTNGNTKKLNNNDMVSNAPQLFTITRAIETIRHKKSKTVVLQSIFQIISLRVALKPVLNETRCPEPVWVMMQPDDTLNTD